MLIPFDPIKAAQASAVLLKTEPARRMSRLRLLKLLYIADRECLKERKRPITGDRPVAMDHGPVLSHTYDLLKGKDVGSPAWDRYLHTVGRDVELVEDPGVGKLSRYEIERLQEVANRFRDWNDWKVADYTHEFPEYKRNEPPKGSRNPIPVDHVLEAIGLLELKSTLEANAVAEARADRFFARAARNATR